MASLSDLELFGVPPGEGKMRHLWVIAVLAISSRAIANDAGLKAQVECEDAATAQYKKQVAGLYDKMGSRPITVQEVMADRRMTEAYCLKYAGCGAKNRGEQE